jgi:uncharacterized protein YcgI (DUF1989 family)
VVPPGLPWAKPVDNGDMLRLIDLEGQQAVDFLCCDAADPTDRYSVTNTTKVQRSLYVAAGSVLYSDLGNALFTVVADTCGGHDTFYGCCSQANNFLRYGVPAPIAASPILLKYWRDSGPTAALSLEM